MSDHEHEPREQRSTVKISQNAKGDAQVEVKLVAGDGADVEALARRAAAIWRDTVAATRGGAV